MDILSHYPKKLLKEHVDQVLISTDFLLKFHSEKTKNNLNFELLEKIIKLHDTGKGCREFQKFIKNPNDYNDNPELKNHSFLSTLISGLFFITKREKWENIFSALQIILGHHTKLRTFEEFKKTWYNDFKLEVIKEQIHNYPLKEISEVLKISLNDIQLKDSCSINLIDYIEDDIEDNLNPKKFSKHNAIKLRLKTQFLYSLLLESDKALLAVENFETHKEFKRHNWKSDWIDNFIGNPDKTEINNLRNEIKNEVLFNSKNNKSSVFSLTAPTGSGKTLLSASWALMQRKLTKGTIPKIIIVLPFLSIINQTVEVYNNILKTVGIKKDGSWLIGSHSLSDRIYHSALEEKEESFFVDTWRSDVIITTYDQFFYSIFNPKSKYQIRFHNLLDSIIIMDEVQSLPTKLWNPLEKILYNITEISETKVLLMSATLPAFVKKAYPLLKNFKDYFSRLNRYVLDISNLSNAITYTVDEFCGDLSKKIDKWIKKNERVLITLNTRKSAQNVFLFIRKYLEDNENNYPLFFISSDVIPKDRIYKINEIKKQKPCIVVSTQSIEAGVDIDMDRVIRDFAPLDSLIQIAGRCNRNGKNPLKEVKIIQLKTDRGRLYSEMIYDTIHLQKSRQVLNKYNKIAEKDILLITEEYFDLLMGKDGVDLGKSYIHNFSYWMEYESIKTVLRGKEVDKYEFVLLHKDEELRNKISEINEIEDIWERKEKWKRISGRIAGVSLSVIAKKNFSPEEVSEYFCGLWILEPEYYKHDIGFVNPESSNGYLVL